MFMYVYLYLFAGPAAVSAPTSYATKQVSALIAMWPCQCILCVAPKIVLGGRMFRCFHGA